MIIKSITLKNFRQFRGEHTIDFSMDHDKNVTVVMGENGSGKTTLEQAFLWCLYEKAEAFQNASLINIDLQNEMAIDDSVMVSVILKIYSEGELYKIERKQYLKKKTMISFYKPTPVFKVSHQNKNGDWEDVPDMQRVSTIENMLPEKLSGFFFFDGEHIESMSEELLQKKRSKNFQDAVRALVGLNSLQAAMDHFGPENLKRTVIGQFTAEIDGDADSKLPEITNRLDELERNIKYHEEKKEKYQQDYDKAEKMLQEKELELKSMQEGINNGRKYDEFKKKITDEEKQKEIDFANTLKSFSRDSFYMLLFPLMKNALEELRDTEKIDKGIPHIHADTIKFLLARGRCICGNDLKRNQNCINRMKDLMESLPPNNIGTMIGNFVKDIKIAARSADTLADEFIGKGGKYFQHDTRIEEYQEEIKILESRLPDAERVATLNKLKKELEMQKSKIRAEHDKQTEEIGWARREIERLEKKRNTIINSSSRNRVNRLYYEYAKMVYNRLREEYDKRVVKTKEELQNVINEIFTEIYDSQIGIEIKDDYSIKTYLLDNTIGADNLDKNTAQSYAVIFAFIAGIIKMHMQHKEQGGDGLPMVMDAPLSAFDKDRIKRICEALPAIAQQIIIFIKDTDGDIAEEHMANVIGKKWMIQAESQTISRIVERG